MCCRRANPELAGKGFQVTELRACFYSSKMRRRLTYNICNLLANVRSVLSAHRERRYFVKVMINQSGFMGQALGFIRLRPFDLAESLKQSAIKVRTCRFLGYPSMREVIAYRVCE